MKTKIYVMIEGGCLQNVYVEPVPDVEFEVELVDYDNDPDAETPLLSTLKCAY